MSTLDESMSDKERSDRLEAIVDRMAGIIVDKDAEIYALRARLKEAVELLKEHEFAPCPECGTDGVEAHMPDCRYGSFLAMALYATSTEREEK